MMRTEVSVSSKRAPVPPLDLPPCLRPCLSPLSETDPPSAVTLFLCVSLFFLFLLPIAARQRKAAAKAMRIHSLGLSSGYSPRGPRGMSSAPSSAPSSKPSTPLLEGWSPSPAVST